MLKPALCLAIFVLLAGTAVAQRSPLDQFDGQSGCRVTGNTIEISACASLYAEDADRQLDAVVERMLAKARQQLSEINTSENWTYASSIGRAHQSWKTWRDNECALATIDSMNGSVRQIRYPMCRAEFANRRRIQLEAALAHWNAEFLRGEEALPLICVMYPEIEGCSRER